MSLTFGTEKHSYIIVRREKQSLLAEQTIKIFVIRKN